MGYKIPKGAILQANIWWVHLTIVHPYFVVVVRALLPALGTFRFSLIANSVAITERKVYAWLCDVSCV